MSTRVSVIAWLLVTGVVGGYGTFRLTSKNQTLYLPGRTSDGHYQIEMACDSCHTPFGGVAQDACTKCHGEARTAADSHPESKFSDPRNADRLKAIDARKCVTCHTEHWPEGTHKGGATVAADFCVKCHSDVGEERPSHAGMSFFTCSDGGCHNYHDNRALWEDYLGKHLGEPNTLSTPQVPLRTSMLGGSNGPRALTAKDQDAPPNVPVAAMLIAEWEQSAHARAAVNCTGCHGGGAGGAPWVDKPALAACATCHSEQDKGFREGRHGMREAAGLDPMTPGQARLPMKHEAQDKKLGCNTCHGGHRHDAKQAAVDSCLGCHDDQHSKAYQASAHFTLWQAELAGTGAKGTGVSCATCHIPREKREGGAPVLVQHNQNDNLRPNEKMVRNVCSSCHGLQFSLDSMADAELVQKNFQGRPTKHVASLEMVEKRLAGKKKKGAH